MVREDNLFAALINLIFNFYIFLFFIRMFTTTQERYDNLLGMAYRATDPVLRYTGSALRLNQFNFAPLLVIFVLLILKGLIFPTTGIAGIFRDFFSFLFQVYALILIIIMGYREYFVNPIINFTHRLVNPIRAIAANITNYLPNFFSNKLLMVNIISLLIAILLHTIMILILSNIAGGEVITFKIAILKTLYLILNLTTFFIYVIVINALLTWFSPDPGNPLVQLLSLLAAPIVEPFRRFIPPLGGMFDISPMIAIIALIIMYSIGNGILRAF